MATTPVFIDSVETVKSRLRLSGAVAPDALEMIDNGIVNARIQIYARLSETRVSGIQAIAFVENPTNRTQVLRLLANQVESNLIKLFLVEHMEVRFVDGSADNQQNWNEEGILRGLDSFSIGRLKDQLRKDIENGLCALETSDLACAAGSDIVRASSFGPATTPAAPGDTLRGGLTSVLDII